MIRIAYKNYTSYNKMRYTRIIHHIQDIQIKYKVERNHTLGPSMPQVAFTPLGLPSLASNHSST